MKRQHNFRSYLLGALTAFLVVSMANPTLAAAKKMIEVSTGVKIFIDEVQLYPTDANGNPVDVFIYNGTTYLPVRAVSEALGKPVQWEGSTQSVYIGKHTSGTPAAWLAQMDYFQKGDFYSSWSFDKTSKDNLGNEHLHTLYTNGPASFGGFVIYKLNGQYSRLTALYYQKYQNRDSTKKGELIISGDGIELWRGAVSGGVDPVNIDIDITGVLELKIDFSENTTALGDIALWT